jgi:hypothetical protein
MLPTGELHVLSVDAQDSRSSYQCRTLHRLTGRTQESVTAGRIVVAGKSPVPLREVITRYLIVTAFIFIGDSNFIYVFTNLPLLTVMTPH